MSEAELAQQILELVARTEAKIHSMGYAAPSVLGSLKDAIKELCEKQLGKAGEP